MTDSPVPRSVRVAESRRLAISHHALRFSGGFERYAMSLVAGMHALGVKPVFIAREFDAGLPEYRWVTPARLRTTGMPAKLCDLFFDWRIGCYLRRPEARIDALIACNPTRWADIAICGGTHHGYLSAMRQAITLNDRLKISLERAAYRSAATIVAHSASLQDEIVEHYGIPAEKIRLLYPPTDTSRFKPASAAHRSALRQKLGMRDDQCQFLLASTAHKRKGLEKIANFFSRTSLPITLVTVGRPPRVQIPNVRYMGYRTDMEDIYPAVDFTIMASSYEPFGLVAIESILCGTPVILARGVGCAEVIAPLAAQLYARDAEDGLDAAIEAAGKRWAEGSHRLEDPRACLRYNPDLSDHVEQLLGLLPRP